MEKIIRELYESMYSMTIGYLYYQSRKNLNEIEKIVPDMKEFVLWFLEENRFEVDHNYYQNMCNNLIQILQDITVAMEQEDHVLLHDAVAYGFIDYLEIFIPEEDIKHGNI